MTSWCLGARTAAQRTSSALCRGSGAHAVAIAHAIAKRPPPKARLSRARHARGLYRYARLFLALDWPSRVGGQLNCPCGLGSRYRPPRAPPVPRAVPRLLKSGGRAHIREHMELAFCFDSARSSHVASAGPSSSRRMEFVSLLSATPCIHAQGKARSVSERPRRSTGTQPHYHRRLQPPIASLCARTKTYSTSALLAVT